MCSLLSDTSSLLFPFTVVVSDILLNVLPYFSSLSLFPFLSAILSIAPLSPPSPPSPPSPLSLCNHRSSSINDMGGVKGTNRPLISRRKDRGWGTRSTCADLGGVKASIRRKTMCLDFRTYDYSPAEITRSEYGRLIRSVAQIAAVNLRSVRGENCTKGPTGPHALSIIYLNIHQCLPRTRTLLHFPPLSKVLR